ncbi:MAG: hypothetical protein ACRDZX_12280 [Acidimicrobiales bacterium]
MSYEVELKDNLVELVEGADAYVAEGPLTTFFQGHDGLAVLDSWARRLASFRTSDIVSVHWVEPPLGYGTGLDAFPGTNFLPQ